MKEEMVKQYVAMSKTLSYALRHKPEEFGIVIDGDGFTDVQKLIDGINAKGKAKASPWSMLRPDAALIPCHDAAAYALEGIRFGIDLANKPSVTVKARVKVDEKTNGLSWLWFEELEGFKSGVSKNEALAILNER